MGSFNRGSFLLRGGTLDGDHQENQTPRMNLARVLVVSVSCSLLGLGVVATPAQATTCGYTEYADGTFGPTVCPDGEPNMKVQADYEKVTPAIMALKAASTRKQILKAICTDSKDAPSGVTMYDSLEYQIARYDWARALVHPVMKRFIAGTYC
jgi:hypothetical protein